MRKPVLVIYCTQLVLGGEPISDDYYWEAYQDLYFSLERQGLDVYYASAEENSYKGRGLFQKAYSSKSKNDTLATLQVHTDIVADMVFDRAESKPFRSTIIPVVNPPELSRIINNKLKIYEHFSQFQAMSKIVDSNVALLEAVAAIPGENIVIKAEFGYGGHTVYLGKKSRVVKQALSAQIPFPLLVQEFLDTSMGVPGQKAGVHDVRIKVCGGKITSYFMRMAKPGNLRSNTAQGGRVVYLDKHTIPQELLEIVRRIDHQFRRYPRYYCVDFAYSNQGWKLIELNDYVGLRRVVDGSEEAESIEQLAHYLAVLCKTSSLKAYTRSAARRVVDRTKVEPQLSA